MDRLPQVVSNCFGSGVGKKLIETFNGYFQENGLSEVCAQTETDDVQAINFYRPAPVSDKLKATVRQIFKRSSKINFWIFY